MSPRKRSMTKAVITDSGKAKASGNYEKEHALEEDGTSQVESIITKGMPTSEQSEQLGGNVDTRDEGDAMTENTGDEQNLDFAKELRKKRRNADDEIAQATLSSPVKYSRLRPRKDLPAFQMVELNENDSERIVGMRVKVYWPDSRKWFAGRIKSFDREKILHKIKYDDGDVEELDLKKETFELEVKLSDGFHIKTKLSTKKSKKSLDDNVVSETSFGREFDNVKPNAEIEGESIDCTNVKEDMKPTQGKQQPDDNRSGNDETQTGTARQNLGLTEVDKAKRVDLSNTKIRDC